MKYCINCCYYVVKSKNCNVLNIDMISGDEIKSLTLKPAALMRHGNNHEACGYDAKFFELKEQVDAVKLDGKLVLEDAARKRGRPKKAT